MLSKQAIMNHELKISRKRNAKTIEVHEYHWEKNLKRNAKNPIFKNAKSIFHLANQIGEGKNIWIIGAGYSVEKRLFELKDKLENDIIFATDAIYRYLVLVHGICPDYVFVLDSKKEGLRFFKDIGKEEMAKSRIVISSAVDKEFVELLPNFKEVIGFHMFDPSLPVWGGNSPEPAHKLLPNLNYVPNKGNVFNLALQIAINCKPKEINFLGAEHCYVFDKGKIYTRAKVEDGFDYSVGGHFCRFDKVMVVQKGLKDYITQIDYYNYVNIANQIIAGNKDWIQFNNYSGGLINGEIK